MQEEVIEEVIEETEEIPEELTEETPEETEETGGDDEGYEFEDGTKVKTHKEAIAYQKQLLQQKEHELAVRAAEADAYRQAAQDFQNRQAPAQQQAETPEAWDEKFYSNPKEAIQEITQQIQHQTLTTIQQKQEDERLWGKFLQKHPELADYKDEIEQIIIPKEQKLFQAIYMTKGEDAAIDLAAQRMKSKIERYNDMKKPRKELGKEKTVTPQGTQTSVTPGKKVEKDLSMTDQMKTLSQKRRR